LFNITFELIMPDHFRKAMIFNGFIQSNYSKSYLLTIGINLDGLIHSDLIRSLKSLEQ